MATDSITSGKAPFTGDFLPEGRFADLIGSEIAGDWTLSVSDKIIDDDGQINSWSLEITNNLSSTKY